MAQTKSGLEIRTTNLFQGYLWKQGKIAKGWVRRFFVLIRREQIDELDDSASNILHELCYFETDSSHAECLGSVILEEVVHFETGADAGLPEHEKPAFALKRKQQKSEKQSTKDAGIVDSIVMLFKSSTVDDFEDWTLLFSLPNRQLRLRAETKTSFDSWVSILSSKIPAVRAKIMFEGWIWRRFSIGVAYRWNQRYALIYEGVLYFFLTKDFADKFKLLAARDADSVFLASQVAEDMLSLEFCTLTRHDIYEDRDWVLQFKVEDHVEMTSVVDEAQATAWVLAVRNARHWFEHIPDEHPTRKLVGGTNSAEEEGPMIEQNINPLAQINADGSMVAAGGGAGGATSAVEKLRAEQAAAKEKEEKEQREREAREARERAAKEKEERHRQKEERRVEKQRLKEVARAHRRASQAFVQTPDDLDASLSSSSSPSRSSTTSGITTPAGAHPSSSSSSSTSNSSGYSMHPSNMLNMNINGLSGVGLALGMSSVHPSRAPSLNAAALMAGIGAPGNVLLQQAAAVAAAGAAGQMHPILMMQQDAERHPSLRGMGSSASMPGVPGVRQQQQTSVSSTPPNNDPNSAQRRPNSLLPFLAPPSANNFK